MGLAFAVNLSFLSFLEDPRLFWVDPFEICVELSRVPKRPVVMCNYPAPDLPHSRRQKASDE